MTTQDENRETIQTSAYNPFPEPQTIPSGWDTSGFFSAPDACFFSSKLAKQIIHAESTRDLRLRLKS